MKSTKHATIAFRLAAQLKSQIEAEAAERGMTTSQWLGHAASDTLARDNRVLQAHHKRYNGVVAEHDAVGKALQELTA